MVISVARRIHDGPAVAPRRRTVRLHLGRTADTSTSDQGARLASACDTTRRTLTPRGRRQQSGPEHEGPHRPVAEVRRSPRDDDGRTRR